MPGNEESGGVCKYGVDRKDSEMAGRPAALPGAVYVRGAGQQDGVGTVRCTEGQTPAGKSRGRSCLIPLAILL